MLAPVSTKNLFKCIDMLFVVIKRTTFSSLATLIWTSAFLFILFVGNFHLTSADELQLGDLQLSNVTAHALKRSNNNKQSIKEVTQPKMGFLGDCVIVFVSQASG